MSTLFMIFATIFVLLPFFALRITDTRSDACQAAREIIDASPYASKLPAWKQELLVNRQAEKLRQLAHYK